MNATQPISPPRSSRVGPIVGLAALVGLLGFLGLRVKETLADREALSAVSERAAEPGAAAAPDTVRPAPRKWRPSVPLTGSLSPIQEADLAFKQGGRLARVSVKEGENVTLGQVLATLDCTEASAQSAAALAAVRAAEAGLAMAKDAEGRTLALAQQNVVGDADKVAVGLRRALSEADLSRAQASARLAQAGVDNCRLVAPFAGIVTRVPAGIGKIVGPGEPLFHVQDLSVLQLRASIAEADRALVDVGAAVEVHAEGDGADHESAGKVTAVLPSLDPRTRRVPVLAELTRPDGALYAGAFVRATVRGDAEVEVLALPASAIRPGSQDEVVLVKDGKASLRRIGFTQDADGTLLVQRGLTAQDVVLAAPRSDVVEGALVNAGPTR